jgi:hypothetical protein
VIVFGVYMLKGRSKNLSLGDAYSNFDVKALNIGGAFSDSSVQDNGAINGPARVEGGYTRLPRRLVK